VALPGGANRGAGVGGSSIPSLKEKLDRIFYPKVVAVVGAKQLNNYNWLRAQGTVQGKVYNVNIDRNEWPGAEALGFQSFPSLLDIPEPVDYVVVTVPNKVAPAVLRDCIAKQVGGVHFFTAGFSETGDSENIRLEEDMARMAREAALPIIGPNCVGLFHPKVGLRQTPDQWTGEGGSVGYISQSGTQAQGFSLAAHAHGLGISKSISFGNGTVLDVTDYLEYLAQDEDTKLIGMYLEGVRDGRRFFETLRAVADEKPVLVWKVGRTEAAARATQSHTASVAISDMLWRAMVRQCGGVEINSVEEMLDTLRGLLLLPAPTAEGIALIAISGGHASEMTQMYSSVGWQVPALTPASIETIASYAGLVGGSFRNPIEGPATGRPENLARTLDVLDGEPGIGCIAMEISCRRLESTPAALEDGVRVLREFRQKSRKPLAVVLTTTHPFTETADVRGFERRFMEDAGVACFLDMDRAAKAMFNVAEYHRQRAWLHGDG